MSSRSVLIVSRDEKRVESLSRECVALRLHPVVSDDAAEAVDLFKRVAPELLFIDESIELKSEWPLYHEIALNKQMRLVPMILMIDSSKARDYAFPQDQCVYRVRKGPRMIEAFRAFTEELIPRQLQAGTTPTTCHDQTNRSRANDVRESW